MKILWIKIGGLWPANSGGRLRSFHILAELSRNHEVTVITTHTPNEDSDQLARHLPDCKEVISVPHAAPKRGSYRFLAALIRSWFSSLPVDLYKNRVPALKSQVCQITNSKKFDLCIADFLFAVPNVPLDLPVPVVFFAHNVESMIWKRLCQSDRNPLRRALLELEWRKMHRFEQKISRCSALTLAVSPEDSDYFRSGSGKRNVFTIPTGVDLDYFKPIGNTPVHSTEIVFTGSMDWHPNEDAMHYFIEAIYPTIRAEVPSVTLTVVGRNPSPSLVLKALKAGVRVTGTVTDVRPFMERAAVYVVPLRIGGGTRLKIFEALAMGKAVVSTTIGAEGLPLDNGRHIMRVDDPASFAGQVVALLREPERRARLGSAGRRLMEKSFSWSTVTNDFEQRCLEVAGR